MDSLTREDLFLLADQSGDCLLSLYMPTHRAGPEVQQNRIRFKNLIGRATEAIADGGPEVEPVRSQLEELSKWEANDAWWQHQSDGLALFLDGKQVRQWRLPEAVDSLCVRSDRFHIRPLCRLLQNDGRFYVLAVSQNKVRLLLGTKSSITELEPEELPDDLESALNIDEYVSSLQHHSTSAGGEAMFHGHGGSDLDVKKQDEIQQYFRHINRALLAYFGTEQAPLVFAGVEYLFPLFTEACDYDALIKKPVPGNPDELSGEALHEKAWPVVEPCFDAARQEALEEWGHAVAHQRGSDDLEVVLKAAKRGQIKTLLVAEGERVWDSPTDGKREADETGASDLVNAAVVETLRSGGNVYSVKPDELDKPLAAIFRYATATDASS